MYDFSPDHFFELSSFSHAAIFENVHHVWDVWEHISSYIQRNIRPGIKGRVSPGAYLINEDLVEIGEDTVVEAGAYVCGPCIIGKGCQIRHGAYVRGNVITGDDCVIGHGTEMKSCIMLNGASAAHFAYLGNTLIGNGVNLGAGVKCANLKLNRRPVRLFWGEEAFDTGRCKFGAVIGDKTQIGCNAVTNPGTVLGRECLVYPCVNASGIYPARSIIKTGRELKPALA